MPKRYRKLRGDTAYYPFAARTGLRARQRRHARALRIAGAAAVGYQLWCGPGAGGGGGQQAKRGKYFLHDYIFLVYLLTQ